VDDTVAAEVAARREVLGVVRRILIENLKVDRTPDEIDPDVPLFGTGLGLDSVDAVELLVALETTIGVQLPEAAHAPAHLRTVGSLVSLILAFRAGAPPILEGSEAAFPTGDAPMQALRTSTAFSRLDEVLAVRVAGGAFEALDPLVPTDLFLRDGQMRQSLLLDAHGRPIADTYVAHDDGALWLLVEGMSAGALDAWCSEVRGASVEKRWTEHEVISIHGPYAWELTARLLGEDLVALPYLNLFHFAEGACFRGGKTGEYGYDLLVARRDADAFEARLLETGRAFELARLERAHLAQAKRETFFFDVDAWREQDVTPVELQLSWRVSSRKDYVGRAALDARRTTGRTRVSCVASEAELSRGDRISHGGEDIGRIVHAGFSSARGEWIAHALLELERADAGLVHHTGEREVRSVTPPVLANRSLHVDPRRHSFAERASTPFPPIVPKAP
jgi:acyl carrier protein